MRFGDGDQLNISSRSSRFCRRNRDLLPDAIQIFGDRTHCRSLCVKRLFTDVGALAQAPLHRILRLKPIGLFEAAHHYLLANRPEITQNERIMKRYSPLVVIIITAVICASSFAQDKASLQPNATILS